MIMLSCANLGDTVNISNGTPELPYWAKLDGFSSVLPFTPTGRNSGGAELTCRLPRRR